MEGPMLFDVSIKIVAESGIVARAYKLSTWESEAGALPMSSRPA